MNAAEKIAYHQLHPLKLATDVASGLAATWLFWLHAVVPALALSLPPSIVASALVMRFADLERIKQSRAGRYVGAMMTRTVEAERLTGQAVMWVGAWQHQPLTIGLGALVIVLAWLVGVGRRPAAQ